MRLVCRFFEVALVKLKQTFWWILCCDSHGFEDLVIERNRLFPIIEVRSDNDVKIAARNTGEGKRCTSRGIILQVGLKLEL